MAGQNGRILGVPRWIALTTAIIPIASALIAAARYGYRTTVAIVTTVETRAHAESVFVRKDSFALKSQRDSINYLYEIRGIHSTLAHMDSDFHRSTVKGRAR